VLLLVGGLLSVVPDSGGASPPLRWRWSNPRPHGGNVVDMAYSPGLGVAVQVAELGQIFSSGDLSLWIPRASGTSNDLRGVAYFGARILVVGSSGTVLYADSLDDFRHGTLVGGPIADWFESVAASTALAVAVGDNGVIYTSTNGVAWRRQASANQWLRGVAYGAGNFVAVGENGKIITSPNGSAWTTRANGLKAENFTRVSFFNNRFTAVAEGGVSAFSFNGGTNWFLETTGASNDLFHAASAMGTRLVVGENEVRSQALAGPWVNELAGPYGPAPWTYYTAVSGPDAFFIAGRTGLMEEGRYGTNGVPFFWVPGDETTRQWLWDVANPTNLYVAVGDRATILTSGNGVDWRLELPPDPATNSIFFGVGGTTNLLVAVGDRGTVIISPNVVTNAVGTNGVVTNYSAFGVLWYAVGPVTTNDLQGVAATTNLFVITGDRGAILTSADGTDWALRASPTNRFLSSVTAWPGGWVATGDDGAIVTSGDGMAWSQVPPPTTNWLYRVRYLGGILIAVGQNGTIFTSSNGINWAKQTSGTTRWLNDVAYVDGAWYVVGNSGTVLTSTNGVNWFNGGTITRKNLYAAATDSRQLVTVGIEGVVLRSQVVPITNAVRILSYDHVSTFGASGKTVQNIFLFGGRTDQRFTLDYRTNFETNTWVTGPLLEFFDGSGTLFYLETLTTTNPPPREFYRATLVTP
jgi:hypothetical protein